MPTKPDPVPVPIVQTIYKLCDTCGGSGKVNTNDANGNPEMEICPVCEGSGKIQWGTIE
jgi:DnaJ-class molecular chaperone